MSPTRREVIKSAGLAAGAMTAVGCLSGCSSPEVIEEGPAEVDVASIPVGSALVVEGTGFVVSQPTAGEYKAFRRTCPHAACDVSKVEKAEIICTCHNARFAAADGARLSGPAETGLTEVTTTLDGTTLTISAD
ncbi:Rieske (2Fe-2S) protein [Luteococcus sp. Sow4_B9]|uniref:Rieske (2Fe-2S) protein n=1 Tax=Luteococcus sp. Sow4_B9 TaxID=3438792 RepID=UPI003F9E8632